MCYQSDKEFTKKSNGHMGRMKFDLFRQIIDEISTNGTKALTMAARGEPLLHKELPKFIEYASGKFFEFKINTNAMLLDEKMSRVILESDLNELVFSIDAHTADVYEE